MCPFRKRGGLASLRHTFEMADLGFPRQAGGQFTQRPWSHRQQLLAGRLLFCVTRWILFALKEKPGRSFGVQGGGEGTHSNKEE